MPDMLEAHLQRQIEHSKRFFWHRLRWRAVRAHIPEGQGCELVDVGAGAGLLGEYLAHDRPQVEYRFVEPIKSLATTLTTRHGAAADRSAAPDFAGVRFVTLLDVLEHQTDDDAFLAELVAKMDSGSTLLLTVPAMQRLWSRWDVALGHARRYDKAGLRACLDRSGLLVHEVSYIFPELFPLALWRARRSKADTTPVGTDEVEFPDLPGPLNDLAYVGGSVSLALRRFWPVGTSLFAVATKP